MPTSCVVRTDRPIMILSLGVSVLLVRFCGTDKLWYRALVVSACAGRGRRRTGVLVSSFSKKNKMRHAQMLAVSSHGWAGQRRLSAR